MKASMILHFLPAFLLGAPAVPASEIGCIASYYADHYEGKKMANGQPFHQARLTCASNDWPLKTRLRVRYGDKTVVVVVTDRMAVRFTKSRIDLSKAAFKALSPLTPGIITVGITRLP
jgi:rare lipoprotein A